MTVANADAPLSLDDIKKIFLDIAQRELGPNVKRVKVEAGSDHDGDPIYRVKVIFGEQPANPPSGHDLNRLARLFWTELAERGDPHFPMFSTDIEPSP